MTKDEALKLALSTLNEVRQETFHAEKKVWEAIYTIKKVLSQPERDYERGFIDGMQKQMQSSVDKAVNRMAQPEQEPVAWWNDTGTHIDLNVSGRGTPLYTHPLQRTWVGLTRDEQSFVYDTLKNSNSREDSFWVDFANAIGQALKEKNT